MEKVKNALKSSTRIIIIALIILVLIFLSFFMVKLVPKILSSMANSTVSITSAFFPSNTASTSSGVTLNNTTATNAATASSSATSSSFLTNFFGPRKTDPTPASYSIATSTKQESNNQVNTSNNVVRTYTDRNTNYGSPDLAVTITSIGINSNGAFVATNNFTTTDTVIVKFNIENKGTAPTGSWSMRVDMPSSSVNDQIKTISSGSIRAGAVVSGQAVFNTPALGSNQKVTISIDPNGAIIESNKNNNQASVSLNVTQANNYYNNGYNYNNYNNNYNYNNGYNYNYNNNYNYNCVNGYTNGVYTNCNMSYTNNTPNLTVRQTALGKIDIYNQFTQTNYLRTGDRVAVKFEVTNNSSVYTSSWTWKAQIVGPNPYQYANSYYNNGYSNGYTYNSDGSRTYNPVVVESGLAPGETRTYTASFDGLTSGSNYITIIVDSANNIIETNEGDNTITQSFSVNY
jgi:hypothetical protein